RNSLQRTLDCSLPVTFAFDYPTIEIAVKYLTQVVIAPMESTASQQTDSLSAMFTDTSSIGRILDNETDVLDSEMQSDEDESLSTLIQKLSTHLD
ncbi:acyl carrier protein, partial [Chrysosporum bergii ANA360D]